MRVNQNFVLRKVADTYVVLPVASAVMEFDGMVTLNESGAFLWRLMEQETSIESLAEALAAEYGISKESALGDVEQFLQRLRPAGCFKE